MRAGSVLRKTPVSTNVAVVGTKTDVIPRPGVAA
jgi:hypothetical protein